MDDLVRPVVQLVEVIPLVDVHAAPRVAPYTVKSGVQISGRYFFFCLGENFALEVIGICESSKVLGQTKFEEGLRGTYGKEYNSVVRF